MIEGIHVMLAHVTETVCEVSCSALLVVEVVLSPMWDISREGRDSTRYESKLLDTAYVTRT